jgi:hypothetical protein
MEVIENTLISRMLQIVLSSWKKDLSMLVVVVDYSNVDKSEKTDLSLKSRGKGDYNWILCSADPYLLLDGFDLRVGTSREVLRRIEGGGEGGIGLCSYVFKLIRFVRVTSQLLIRIPNTVGGLLSALK